MSEHKPPRTLEIVSPLDEAVLLFAVQKALDYEQIKRINAGQPINKVKLNITGNQEFQAENSFSYNHYFGANSISHAIVTPSDNYGRTILGFQQEDLKRSPVEALMFIAAAIESGLNEYVEVRYPDSAA